MAAARQPDYKERIDALRDSMAEDLETLVRCRSVNGEAKAHAPFGAGTVEALDAMLGIGRREGMDAVNMDGFAGYIEYGAPADGLFGILSHLDVVPEGNGWTHAAFGPVLEDGLLYGRGTSDDKGPAIAAFYALKALKDCGYTFKKRVRMIFGLNEETGEESLDYYKKKGEIPDFSIVPDSSFPVVRAEMGIMTFDLVKYFGIHRNRGPEIVRITGGAAPNMVPDSAEAVVAQVSDIGAFEEHVEQFASDTGFTLSCEADPEKRTVTVHAKGRSAHGSTPWKGVNAVSVIMAFLSTIGCDSEEMQEMLDFYAFHIEFDQHGERLGIDFKDEESGRLVFNVGMIDMNPEEMRITINVRIPVSFTNEDVKSALILELTNNSIDIVETMYQAPLYYRADDPRITALAEIYRRNTGDTETQPLVIGGGTYARQIDNAVAFGAMYPGDEDRMHGADEYISIDRLVQTAKIYADAIYEFAVK